MQVHLPIAVCLIRSLRDDALSLAVHQVQPENPRSIGEFVTRACRGVEGGSAELLHHVTFFTPRSYAECQSAVRKYIADVSGSRVLGRSKVIVGERVPIVSAMNGLSCDSSAFSFSAEVAAAASPVSSTGKGKNSGWGAAGSSGDDSRGSLGSFIVDDDEDDEDNEGAKTASSEDESPPLCCGDRRRRRRHSFRGGPGEGSNDDGVLDDDYLLSMNPPPPMRPLRRLRRNAS